VLVPVTDFVHLAGRRGPFVERVAAWGMARDVERTLWAASGGHPDDGAKWIRSTVQAAPMLN
jgi:hypothetical protein